MQFVNLLKRRFHVAQRSLKNSKLSFYSKFIRLLSCGSCFKFKHQPYSDEFLAYGFMDAQPGPSNADLNKTLDTLYREDCVKDSACSELSSSISRILETQSSTMYSIDVSSLTDENIAVKGLAQDLRGLRIDNNVPFRKLIKNNPLSVSIQSFAILSDDENLDFNFNDAVGENNSCRSFSLVTPENIRTDENISEGEITVDENLNDMSEGEIPPSVLLNSLDKFLHLTTVTLSDNLDEFSRPPSSVGLTDSSNEILCPQPITLESLDEISILREDDVQMKEEKFHCSHSNVNDEEILATVDMFIMKILDAITDDSRMMA